MNKNEWVTSFVSPRQQWEREKREREREPSFCVQPQQTLKQAEDIPNRSLSLSPKTWRHSLQPSFLSISKEPFFSFYETCALARSPKNMHEKRTSRVLWKKKKILFRESPSFSIERRCARERRKSPLQTWERPFTTTSDAQRRRKNHAWLLRSERKERAGVSRIFSFPHLRVQFHRGFWTKRSRPLLTW